MREEVEVQGKHLQSGEARLSNRSKSHSAGKTSAERKGTLELIRGGVGVRVGVRGLCADGMLFVGRESIVVREVLIEVHKQCGLADVARSSMNGKKYRTRRLI